MDGGHRGEVRRPITRAIDEIKGIVNEKEIQGFGFARLLGRERDFLAKQSVDESAFADIGTADHQNRGFVISRERRNLFHETDEIINEKTRQCLNHGITPIICVGETLSEHNNDETLVKINNQISHAILGLDDLNEKKEIIIAYEPIYAIGTGKTPKVKEIENVINHIYEVLSKYDNIDFKILYGGSVNRENIKKLPEINKLDGVLIGTISSKIEEIIKIIETV